MISIILERHARTVLAKAQEAAAALSPLRSALAVLWAEQRQVPNEEYFGYESGRRPLIELKETIKIFLESVHRIERSHPDPWREARARLRQDPHAALPELAALLSAGS